MRESATFLEIVFDLLVWGSVFLCLKPVLKRPNYVGFRKVNLACFLMILFCLFSFFGGDYFHYMQGYDLIKVGKRTNIEEVYVWFIQNYCPSYIFFRFVVWGLALLLTIKTYKRLEVNFQLSLFFFGTIYLIWFSYARASLAMAFIFCGLSLIAKPIEKLNSLSIICGLLMMVASTLFHRSAIIGIVCAIGSLLFKNPSKNKNMIILLCILYPVILSFVAYIVSQFVNIDFTDGYVSNDHIDTYLSGDAKDGLSMGIGSYIMSFFARVPLFVVFVTYIYCVFKGYFKDFPVSVKIISSYAFVLILLAITFCFDLGYNTYVLYYRTLVFAHIPSAVFLAQLYSSNCTPRLFKWIYYPSLFGVFYTLIYSAYCTLV